MPRSRQVKKLGESDQLVDWFKTRTVPPWIERSSYDSMPDEIRLRELQYRIGCPGFRTQEVTLVTTLLDGELYPLEDIAMLYCKRWEIETDFAHLKTTMKMDMLRCKTVKGVLKELCMFVLVYNLVRMAMLQSSELQRVDVERISFVDALRWLASASSSVGIESLVVNPLRPNRFEPRVRKRRPKQTAVMVRHRAVLQKELVDKHLTT